MKYFKMMYDYNSSENYVSCNAGELQGILEYSAIMGNPLKTKWVPPTLPYNEEEGDFFSDYLHNIYGWLIVSSHFVNYTQPYVENCIEYLDVIITNNNGQKRADYKVANVIDVIDALDLEHSIYDTYYAGEEIKKVIEKHHMTGFSFVQVKLV